MVTDYIQQIVNNFRNLSLNTLGVERDIYRLLMDKDVDKALSLMEDNQAEVDNALEEYIPQKHAVMNRRDKDRRGKAPYISEKLPRGRQRYINEVELFFLLGKPLKWSESTGDEKAFKYYKDFLKETRFDSKFRQCKRLAGAETESALIFRLYNEGGEVKYHCFVAARSLGYKIRPMFDQYKRLSALAYGYTLKENGKSIEHWDIQTKDGFFMCRRDPLGWQVESYNNPCGKIISLYFHQRKAWDGVEQRLNREEMLDSKVADTNNYFADPIAAASADVIESMMEGDSIGRMINLVGGNSRFEYINPPQSSETRRDEMSALERSILFDTFTPDLSFEALKGFGAVSGAAIKNAMTLGYIKRANLLEYYEEMASRFKNVAIAILKVVHPSVNFDSLDINFEFQEPFEVDIKEEVALKADLHTKGLMSTESAVTQLGLVEDATKEINRIKEEKATQQTA